VAPPDGLAARPSRSEPDPWVAALRRALVVLDGPLAPVPPEQRAQAAKAAERATKDIGAGIDPAPLVSLLDRFAAALRSDPACVEAYLGIGRVAQLLAGKRPRAAEELCTVALEGLDQATRRLPAVQGSRAVLELETRLREVRAEARARPRPAPGVEADPVRLARDREGRVVRPLRQRAAALSSAMLQALRHGGDVEGDAPPEGRRLAARAALMLAAIGLVLAAIVAVAVSVEDRSDTAWPSPALSIRAREGLALARPLLALDAPLQGEVPLPAIVVTDGGGLAARRDPLQSALPRGVAATAGDVRALVVVRRYDGPAGALDLLWVVDLDASRPRVLARTAIPASSEAEADRQASAWLRGLDWRR
jgi:hypothetical protein